MQNEVTGNGQNEIASDFVWLTYAELGRAREISAASAQRLATRRRWRRQQDNDGTTRVAVPVAEASPRESEPGDNADSEGVAGLVAVIEAAHIREATALRERVDAAEQARAAAQNLAEQSLALIAVERGRAERAEAALAAERTRADWLRNRLDDLNAKLSDTQNNLSAAQNDLAAAQESLTAARDLEAARKAGGRWANGWEEASRRIKRLLDQWRGAASPWARAKPQDARNSGRREKAEWDLEAFLKRLREAVKRRPPWP